MGVGPPLPAPTDPSSLSSATGTDQATDVSRRTDRTSYSIPEDGSPVTISTRRKRTDREKDKDGRLTRSHHSQTSLLIEYFEGGKGRHNVQARPSVRVKVTPSSARKTKDANEHIQITETGRSRQPSYTKHISLAANAQGESQIVDVTDDQSSFASATEESALSARRRPPPVEVEVMRRGDDESLASATSSPRDSRYVRPNPSEISSMPPDSLVDAGPGRTPRRVRSRSLERERTVAAAASDTLQTPGRRRSRSLSRDRSRERITQKAIEKLRSKPVESGSRHKRHSKSPSRSRSVSVSKEQAETLKSSGRRRSGKSQREDDLVSGAESSLLTTSQLSPSHKSGDQFSFRSGTSKSSLNNPRLLETVEDAIRRLILPELTALKHEQKTQRNRSRFEESTRESVASTGSAASRDERRRRVSKMSSAPDVAVKPKVVLNPDDQGRGIVLSGDTIKRKKGRKTSRGSLESPSERSYDRDVSEETLTEGRTRVKRSKERQALVAAGGAAAGVLTTAALRHHDSRSSVDPKERRKRRSKSRSRSASLAEEMEYPAPEDMPPMPLSSAINGSELTRASILTARTERPPSASQERHAEAELVSRGSRQSLRGLQQGFGVHHSNASRGDLSIPSPLSATSLKSGGYITRAMELGLAAAASVGPVTVGSSPYHAPVGEEASEHDRGQHHRSLSPIQSAVGEEDGSVVEPNARDSFTSSLTRRSPRKNSTVSIDSVSLSPSSAVAKAKRSQDAAYEHRNSTRTEDTLHDREHLTEEGISRDADGEYWHDEYPDTDRSRNGDGQMEPRMDGKHMTNSTDDGLDGVYLDKLAAGQRILAVGANPEFRHTPIAVASAVASLHNPSVVDVHSTRSGPTKAGHESYPNSLHEYLPAQLQVSPARRKPVSSREEAPSVSQKPPQNGSEDAYAEKSAGLGSNTLGEDIAMGTSGIPVPEDPLPEPGYGVEDESDINTNPSIIHGPIGGVAHGNRDHWPYDPTPPQPNGHFLDGHSTPHGREDMSATEAGLLGTAAGAGLGVIGSNAKGDTALEHGHKKDLQVSYDISPSVDGGYTDGVNHDFGTRLDSYQDDNVVQATPLKDEGYISAANPRSPAAATPESKNGRMDPYANDRFDVLNDGGVDDDPFISTKHMRHLSGNSHGMPSPLYDGATGKGIDRIQSKDIVALMDHLTVRDAQRNARDTEILVTLVRSAAEMRNSFEDMKKLLAEQESHIINTTEKNTERSVQKVINGPRPLPLGTPRSVRRVSAEEERMEELRTKRGNVFRRALKGLSMRSSNDLAKIEEMLVQLLGDVEGLKAAQEPRPSVTNPNSLNSYDNLQTVPEGYEPEGQAGTGSTNHSGSGFFSNPPSRQASAMKGFDNRVHEHRISTVHEGDEDLAVHEEGMAVGYAKGDQLLSPGDRHIRGSSAPLDSPQQVSVPAAPHSSENTPKTDKSRKHKSTSSSIFPKLSRWSETTASTVAKPFRSSGRKEREYSEGIGSRSGSKVDVWDYQRDVQDDDRLQSTYSLENTPSRQENRPRSPLIPPSSTTQEDPRYQAHRDSRNLQHPQPRQGPTHRYQYQLESQAQNFDSPISPSSEQWASNPNLTRLSAGSTGNRYSGGGGGAGGPGHLSPISDGGYSQRSAAGDHQSTTTTGPPRPPKILDDPLLPARPPKVSSSSSMSNSKPQYASPLGMTTGGAEEGRYANGSGSTYTNGSPRSNSGRIPPQRKPTGPRPLSSNNNNKH